jgi:hypothetical protein
MRAICAALAVILVAAAISGAAQQLADCAQIKSPGCKSFNEMLTNRDPDIVEAIKQPNYITYVCFQPNDDAFTMLTFSLPTNKWKRTQECWEAERKKITNSPACHTGEQGYQTFISSTYRHGLYNDSFELLFTWMRGKSIGTVGQSNYRELAGGRTDGSLAINDTELVLSYNFPNKEGSTTVYSMQLRRATKRFVETFEPSEGKSIMPITVTGYCSEFHEDKPHSNTRK